MRWLRCSVWASAFFTLAGLGALNWRAQIQTQQKLDALTAALAERPAAPVPVPAAAAPTSAAVAVPPAGVVPRELEKVTLPPYVIEAPDVLTVEVRMKDPTTGAVQPLPGQPVAGPFIVRPDGTINLGAWGTVLAAGRTVEQAAEAVRKRFATKYYVPVDPDALVIALDVVAFNSKAYYLITDFAGRGEQIVRFPLTGNETVLDAVARAGGLADMARRGKVWVARPGTGGGAAHVLPIDWKGITQDGVTATNYQILPGDRVFIKCAAD